MIAKHFSNTYFVTYMKFLTSLILSFAISFTNNAQTFLPLVEIEKQWNEYGYLYPDAQWTEYYFIGSDTLINNIEYTKLLHDYNIPFTTMTLKGFLRENDSAKVYFIPLDKDKNSYDQEYLLYDFNSQAGDTLEVYSIDWLGTCLIVIDSVILEDYYEIERHKYYYHNLEGSTDGLFIIEGLGSSQGLLNSCMTLIDAGNSLLCVYKDTTLLYYNPEIWIGCEVPSTVEIHEQPIIESPMIYPNPSNGIFKVKFEDNKNMVVKMINLIGEVVLTIKVEANEFIEIPKSINSSGIYIYLILGDNQIIGRGKLILK